MSTSITTYSMILASLMSDHCERTGITLQNFYQETGISTGTWSRIMRGKAHFQIEDIRSACRIMNCKVSDLTKSADKAELELINKEEIIVIGKKDVEKNSVVPTVIATAALAFLISRILK